MIKSQMREALNMPWVVGYEIKRYLALPYIRLMFALNGVQWGRRWRIWGMPIIQRFRGSRINIGDGLLLRSWKSTNPLVPNHPVVLATRTKEATIKIGHEVGLTGTTIVAAEHIEIGDRVLIGSNVTIVDTDFHPLEPIERQKYPLNGRKAPVIIEEDVFIGMSAIILKGTRIGRGAVIGAGSVVVCDIQPGVIAAGNPAQIIRTISNDDNVGFLN